MDHPSRSMKTRCPKCGKLNRGSFCIICGTPAPTQATQKRPSNGPHIIIWFRRLDMPRKVCVIGGLTLILLLSLSFTIPNRPPHAVNKTSQNSVSTEVPPVSTAPSNPSAALAGKESEPLSTVRHVDPKGEGSPEQIAAVLQQVQVIGVFCGDDVDQQTCKFFSYALRTDLEGQHVNIGAFYQPQVLAQSFYVPPMPLPFTGTTLRLIEHGSPEALTLYLGGFCFDAHASDSTGLQLPIWSQLEGGKDTGPLEADKAAAASKVAHEFSAYWIDTMKRIPL